MSRLVHIKGDSMQAKAVTVDLFWWVPGIFFFQWRNKNGITSSVDVIDVYKKCLFCLLHFEN